MRYQRRMSKRRPLLVRHFFPDREARGKVESRLDSQVHGGSEDWRILGPEYTGSEDYAVRRHCRGQQHPYAMRMAIHPGDCE
jgi:hypothetical protein